MIWSTSESDLRLAAQAIQDGKIVAVPTETVYGLAANALDPEAVASIFRAKGRPADNPLIVHISRREDLSLYAEENDWARLLADRFWPGPLTMILPKRPVVPYAVTAGLDSVAVRFPSHETARKLIDLSGCPLAAPSANRSGKPSGTTALHVLHDFGDSLAGVVDGGSCACGLESTVVSLIGDRPVLLRPGFITPEQLREVLPNLTVARAVEEELKKDEAILSPGLAHRHYAPSSEAIGVIGSGKAVADYIAANRPDGPYAVMCFDGEESLFQADSVVTYGHEGVPEEQGERLFDTLRELDAQSWDKIFIHVHRDGGVGLAVYNRLLRACGFRMVFAEDAPC